MRVEDEMDAVSSGAYLVGDGAVRRHPFAWTTLMFSLWFTVYTVGGDLLHQALGWESLSRRSVYLIALGMTAFLFVYAQVRASRVAKKA